MEQEHNIPEFGLTEADKQNIGSLIRDAARMPDPPEEEEVKPVEKPKEPDPTFLSEAGACIAGGAADATDAIIVTPGNTNFYVGGVTFLDSDNEVSSVFSDGNSNSSIQLNVPAGFDITIVGKDSTNYQIFGNVTSATAPVFADQ